MSPPISHRRTHNLLLISRLLNLRDPASPFTLLLDTLSQSSKPLVREYIRRGSVAKCKTIFVAFETVRGRIPEGVSEVVVARGKSLEGLGREILELISSSGGGRTLLILDSLNPLSTTHPSTLPHFLSTLLSSPTTTLLATYHLDVLLPPPLPSSSSSYPDSAPHPLVLLKYLSTTIITLHSIEHILIQKRHKDRSLPVPPVWGVEEGVEGVVVGMGANCEEGFVMEMEHRRKSGRGVLEWFFLPRRGDVGDAGREKEKERIILLEDHPSWRLSEEVVVRRDDGFDHQEEGLKTTFELGITERQKKARDEVVLPYFDAQREGGGGGGAILFTPEREVDDFDEEEDEL